MDLHERLAALGLRKGTAHLSPRPVFRPRRGPAIEELIAGAVVENEAGACFVAEERRPASYPHGRLPLRAFLELPPATLGQLAREPARAGIDPRRILFVDTETTGLAGGAGTYAFLIGVGYFSSEDTFVIRQFFMRDFGEEPALLRALVDELGPFEAVASFNGKAFDLPLIETRLALARLPFGLLGAPHYDLLFPARRLRGPPAHSLPWR